MSGDEESLEKLHASLSSSHDVGQKVREKLIESMGDHLCGTGPGPTEEELETFAAACRAEAAARRKMARFVTVLTRKFIARIKR